MSVIEKTQAAVRAFRQCPDTIKLPIGVLQPHPAQIKARPIIKRVVSEYAADMRKGAIFPPLIVQRNSDDENTYDVICGNQTLAAHVLNRKYGAEYETVSATVVEPMTVSEVLVFAYRSNGAHGVKNSSWTTKQVLWQLFELGCPKQVVADMLNISVDRVTEKAGMYVIVNGVECPIKSNWRHNKGKVVSEESYTEHKYKDTCQSDSSCAAQLLRHLKRPTEVSLDPETLKNLAQLPDAIKAFFNHKAVKAAVEAQAEAAKAAAAEAAKLAAARKG